MKDYKKLIQENEGDFKNPEQLIDFLDSYMQEGQEVADHEDNIHEYADSLVPIYYTDIIEGWRDKSECRGQAAEEGLIEGETDVYKIMQADLYAHYYGELYHDFTVLTGIIEDMEIDQ